MQEAIKCPKCGAHRNSRSSCQILCFNCGTILKDLRSPAKKQLDTVENAFLLANIIKKNLSEYYNSFPIAVESCNNLLLELNEAISSLKKHCENNKK